MIDLQVNGFAGIDLNDGCVNTDRIHHLSDSLAAAGTTSWMPTIITAEASRIVDAIRVIHEARAERTQTRNAILGIHVEGPFISEEDGARGVHDPAHIRRFDLTEVQHWRASGGPISILTLSPHSDAAISGIPYLLDEGIVVSIGHTHATPAQIRAAAAAGARMSTHLGNGIAPILPRHPNAIWAQLAAPELTVGLIADGHHLPFDTLEAMIRAKLGAAFLVSDTTEVGGMPAGCYRTAVGGAVELSTTGRLSWSGTDLLAGAATPLMEGVRNVIAHTGIGVRRAISLATSVPAAQIRGTGRLLGTTRTGSPADLILASEQDGMLGAIEAVYQRGVRVR